MIIEQFDIIRVMMKEGDTVGKVYLVVSPSDMNKALETLMVVPFATSNPDYPFRPTLRGSGTDKFADVCLDQIATIHKMMVLETIDQLALEDGVRMLSVIREIFT